MSSHHPVGLEEGPQHPMRHERIQVLGQCGRLLPARLNRLAPMRRSTIELVLHQRSKTLLGGEEEFELEQIADAEHLAPEDVGAVAFDLGSF